MYDTLDKSKRMYCIYKQDDDDTNANRLKNFKNLVAVVIYYSDNLFNGDALVTHEINIDTKFSNSSKKYTEYRIIV